MLMAKLGINKLNTCLHDDLLIVVDTIFHQALNIPNLSGFYSSYSGLNTLTPACRGASKSS